MKNMHIVFCFNCITSPPQMFFYKYIYVTFTPNTIFVLQKYHINRFQLQKAKHSFDLSYTKTITIEIILIKLQKIPTLT